MSEPKVPLMLNVPVSMKAEIDRQATEKGEPASSYARRKLAEAIGFSLSRADVGRARKYATVEERIAAQKARKAERDALIRKLLAEYEASQSVEEVE